MSVAIINDFVLKVAEDELCREMINCGRVDIQLVHIPNAKLRAQADIKGCLLRLVGDMTRVITVQMAREIMLQFLFLLNQRGIFLSNKRTDMAAYFIGVNNN